MVLDEIFPQFINFVDVREGLTVEIEIESTACLTSMTSAAFNINFKQKQRVVPSLARAVILIPPGGRKSTASIHTYNCLFLELTVNVLFSQCVVVSSNIDRLT